MGPAAVAGLQLASSTGQGIFGLVQQKRQNKANMKMAEYAYSKDLEQWNRGNAYNAPEAQMQRLKEAGLNPNLVYGTGAVGNTGGQLPKYNAPTVDYSYRPPVDAVNVIGAYQDFTIKQAQVNNLREQNKILQEEGKIKTFQNWLNDNTGGAQKEVWENKAFKGGMENYWRNMILQQDEFGKRIDNKYKEDLRSYQNEYAKGKINAQDTAMRLQEQQMRKMDKDTEYREKQLEYYMVNLLGPYAAKALAAFTGKRSLNKTTNDRRTTQDAQKWRKFEEAYKK